MAILAANHFAERIVGAVVGADLPLRAQVLQAEVLHLVASRLGTAFARCQVIIRHADIVTGVAEGSAAQKIDWVVGVQGTAAGLVQGAVAGGLPGDCTRFFASSSEAAPFLADLVQPGDLLLVKGSRGVKMERIVEALRARFALAADDKEMPASIPGRA